VNADFISAIQELGKEKGIDSELLFQAVEDALVAAYKKNTGATQNVRVDLNRETGEIHVYAQRVIVEGEPENANEISLAEAQEINANYVAGDIVELEVTSKDFGRIATQNAKQVVVQRIREAERGQVYERFQSRANDIVTGIIERMENKNVYIDLGKVEAVLTPNEQIPGEIYQYHERMKTYIVEVKRTSKGPQIMVSRTHPGLLKRLFELEVPEIHDGVVEIKSVAREPGMRSKISVYTADSNVDPVGACVGHKGMRVQTIVGELRGEKIDIVKYSEDPAQYVANALSPAKVVRTAVNEGEKICRVVVPDYQLSLAIGKEGQNARLAAKLTGWKIDIKSETQAANAAAEEDAQQEAQEQE
jgi:transcription termination/antitermination protein NusA